MAVRVRLSDKVQLGERLTVSWGELERELDPVGDTVLVKVRGTVSVVESEKVTDWLGLALADPVGLMLPLWT